jgi:serine/threonine protein kinase
VPNHPFDLITYYLQYNGYFVQSFGWYENAEAVFVTLEYFPLGDLQRYITKPLPEGEAQQITHQVLEGVRFMHENDYAHRDLKPAVRAHNLLHVFMSEAI